VNLDDVMTELANRLATVSGVDKVYPYPPDDSPAMVVGWVEWPEGIDYDDTMRRGQDRASVTVTVAVPRATDDRVTWQKVAAFADGSGASSVKTVLEAGSYTTIGELRVTGAVFDYGLMAGNPAISARFSVDVTGAGA
jgi:hypothetical protein